ncbi:hypothetical protein IWQ62_000127 [Dispira parvispora]|uniref:N-acetyltransferase domain-containing protein n=1 Tax=Dispira parvispora TaxID=1520584 RepID=A0A9W8B0Q8_9FUNG|nr:hypothetical protein IWQ62_000127 [Dispira parvispora]
MAGSPEFTTTTTKGDILTIRDACTPEEHDIFLQWSDACQWDPCPSDYAIYGQIPTNRMLLGFVQGRIVACLAVHVFENRVVFFGPYIVLNPMDRGKGYGHCMLQYMLDQFPDYDIGCDTELDRIEYYHRYGMETYYTVYCVRGDLPTPLMSQAARHLSEYQLVSATEISLDFIVNMDYEVTGFRRTDFCQKKFHDPSQSAFALCSADQKEILGLACIAPTISPGLYLISPLYAKSPRVARALALELMQRVVDQHNVTSDMNTYLNFTLYCQETNPDALDLFLNVFGWKSVGVYKRLWKGGIPTAQYPQRLYGYNNSECG